MSYWGATVITNLFSAIPFIGTDIVQFINLMIKFNEINYENINFYYSILPIVGKLGKNSNNKNMLTEIEKEKLLSIPHSFLSVLIGIIDGDGYIRVTKTTKGFIEINLTIALDIRDKNMLMDIKKILGIGNINTYPKIKPNIVKLIFNRTDLQKVLFPLFLYHKLYFLTDTRIQQYNLAIYIMNTGITKYQDINQELIPKSNIILSPEDYLNLSFFKNWIVGFTITEGSFFFKNNGDACFELRQRTHLSLFESFKLIFNTTRKIGIENNYSKFSISSKADIQNVIRFFSINHPLMGYKLIQYNNFISQLKSSKRYSNLEFFE